jgi:hypothetical protein
MTDGFIVRRGGAGAGLQALAPSILDFSSITTTEIKFKLRNNDAETATLVYRFGTFTADSESISVAGNTTTDEITFAVPLFTTPTKLFVTANVTGKVKSEVAEQEFEVPKTYITATGGTTLEYNSGGKRYKSHTFTSNGTFAVIETGDNEDDRNKVDFLVIGGGGSGSGGIQAAFIANGGGGGAGGFRTTLGPTSSNVANLTKPAVTAQNYSVTIAGGGCNSSVFGFTSNAGGVGGANSNGGGGASGGGASQVQFSLRSGGSGIVGQGRNGGSATETYAKASGGGGAGAVGQNGPRFSPGGNGGSGLANALRTGSNETRAGGGGGHDGGGGAGGGGNGRNDTTGAPPTSGAANTGGGGGGHTSNQTPGSGGSGIVVIRYEIEPTV